MKLSKAQRELLQYMQGGGVVMYQRTAGFWFRSDNHSRVSATVRALEKAGMLNGYRSTTFAPYEMALTDAGRAYNTEAPDAS